MIANQNRLRIASSIDGQRVYLLDYKRGDVTGDGVPDNIYLYGNKPEGASGIFANNITLVIQDGRVHHSKAITPAFNSGFYPRLFLGDFDKDGTADIKVSIDAGDKGSAIIAYIYAYRKNVLKELFSFDSYNAAFRFDASFRDYYKFCVTSVQHNRLFSLDLTTMGGDYLSSIYEADGRLHIPRRGNVTELKTLYPLVSDEKNDQFDLLTRQAITGLAGDDILGYMENVLSWDGDGFSLKSMSVAAPGGILHEHENTR